MATRHATPRLYAREARVALDGGEIYDDDTQQSLRAGVQVLLVDADVVFAQHAPRDAQRALHALVRARPQLDYVVVAWSRAMTRIVESTRFVDEFDVVQWSALDTTMPTLLVDDATLDAPQHLPPRAVAFAALSRRTLFDSLVREAFAAAASDVKDGGWSQQRDVSWHVASRLAHDATQKLVAHYYTLEVTRRLVERAAETALRPPLCVEWLGETRSTMHASALVATLFVHHRLYGSAPPGTLARAAFFTPFRATTARRAAAAWEPRAFVAAEAHGDESDVSEHWGVAAAMRRPVTPLYDLTAQTSRWCTADAGATRRSDAVSANFAWRYACVFRRVFNWHANTPLLVFTNAEVDLLQNADSDTYNLIDRAVARCNAATTTPPPPPRHDDSALVAWWVARDTIGAWFEAERSGGVVAPTHRRLAHFERVLKRGLSLLSAVTPTPTLPPWHDANTTAAPNTTDIDASLFVTFTRMLAQFVLLPTSRFMRAASLDEAFRARYDDVPSECRGFYVALYVAWRDEPTLAGVTPKLIGRLEKAFTKLCRSGVYPSPSWWRYVVDCEWKPEKNTNNDDDGGEATRLGARVRRALVETLYASLCDANSDVVKCKRAWRVKRAKHFVVALREALEFEPLASLARTLREGAYFFDLSVTAATAVDTMRRDDDDDVVAPAMLSVFEEPFDRTLLVASLSEMSRFSGTARAHMRALLHSENAASTEDETEDEGAGAGAGEGARPVAPSLSALRAYGVWTSSDGLRQADGSLKLAYGGASTRYADSMTGRRLDSEDACWHVFVFTIFARTFDVALFSDAQLLERLFDRVVAYVFPPLVDDDVATTKTLRRQLMRLAWRSNDATALQRACDDTRGDVISVATCRRNAALWTIDALATIYTAAYAARTDLKPAASATDDVDALQWLCRHARDETARANAIAFVLLTTTTTTLRVPVTARRCLVDVAPRDVASLVARLDSTTTTRLRVDIDAAPDGTCVEVLDRTAAADVDESRLVEVYATLQSRLAHARGRLHHLAALSVLAHHVRESIAAGALARAELKTTPRSLLTTTLDEFAPETALEMLVDASARNFLPHADFLANTSPSRTLSKRIEDYTRGHCAYLRRLYEDEAEAEAEATDGAYYDAAHATLYVDSVTTLDDATRVLRERATLHDSASFHNPRVQVRVRDGSVVVCITARHWRERELRALARSLGASLANAASYQHYWRAARRRRYEWSEQSNDDASLNHLWRHVVKPFGASTLEPQRFVGVFMRRLDRWLTALDALSVLAPNASALVVAIVDFLQRTIDVERQLPPAFWIHHTLDEATRRTLTTLCTSLFTRCTALLNHSMPHDADTLIAAAVKQHCKRPPSTWRSLRVDAPRVDAPRDDAALSALVARPIFWNFDERAHSDVFAMSHAPDDDDDTPIVRRNTSLADIFASVPHYVETLVHNALFKASMSRFVSDRAASVHWWLVAPSKRLDDVTLRHAVAALRRWFSAHYE